jgi:hypothetical protein
MVDDLRTSEIEESEKERNIRLYIGEHHDGKLECFGVIPSLEWGAIPQGVNVHSLLQQTSIDASGIPTPPVATNFHPSESETRFGVEPAEEEFVVEISGPNELAPITGRWTADGLATGDLFIGDQSRARRYRSDRQVKEGEWVYLVVDTPPRRLPDVVTTYELGPVTVLAFPAREATVDLLERYGNGLTTDSFGFDADVILPARAHPTIEAPIQDRSGVVVLVGVTPAEGLDPTFEVVPIPKESGAVLELDPTGPGNPRYHETRIPTSGSDRFSIHQQNSNRHRLVHLHETTDESQIPEPAESMGHIGIQLELDDDPVRVTPLGEIQSYRFDSSFNLHLLPTMFKYEGPEGLQLELTARFIDEATFGPTKTKFTDDPTSIPSDILHWATNGCQTVHIDFDGVGTVTLEFAQPDLATALDTEQTASGGGQ